MSTNQQEHKQARLLSINGIDLKIKEEFTHYAKENALTQGELLKMLWSNFQNLYIPLTSEEQKLVSKAQDISAKSIKTKLKKTLLRLSERATKEKEVNTDVVVNKDTRNSSKAADLRAIEIVNEMMLENDTEEKRYNLRFLSQKAIFDYARERKDDDSNKLALSIPVITRYLDNHLAEIKQHHTKHNLNENHNRIAHYERLKISNTTNKPTEV